MNSFNPPHDLSGSYFDGNYLSPQLDFSTPGDDALAPDDGGALDGGTNDG